MKKMIYALMLLAFSLASCAGPAATPVANTQAVPIANGKIPAASFESQTYINQTVGFALDYPTQWTVKESVTGQRGSQTLLLSAPEIADVAVVPEGATRISINVNQWDPKNDLAAYVETRKTAWSASGFTIEETEPVTLDLGLAAVRITVQTPEGVTVPFLFAALNDQYLTISGEGDITLVKEIMQRLRPVSVQ
ncbi:MAG: hypothetical protein ABI986_04710 [Chloroflexota bacterium]